MACGARRDGRAWRTSRIVMLRCADRTGGTWRGRRCIQRPGISGDVAHLFYRRGCSGNGGRMGNVFPATLSRLRLRWHYADAKHGDTSEHRHGVRCAVLFMGSFNRTDAFEVCSLMPQLQSTITCPRCNHQASETMPTEACQFFYDCKGCGVRLKPKAGDCCVFCSYGSVPCPPIQAVGSGEPGAASCCA
jgi:hypothetical protein